MISLTSIAAAGFILGMRHATDADHVIAVSTIVSRERSVRGATLIGAMWGIGHTLTVAAVGSAILIFSLVIPPGVGLSMELGVGLMLVLLGLLALRPTAAPEKVYRAVGDGGKHWHVHRHGDFAHSHMHGHGRADHGHAPDATPTGWLDRRLGRMNWYRVVRPFVVGIVHGLAGSAAIALLFLPAVHDIPSALGYLLLFGVGTIAGMMLITAAIAVPFAWTGTHSPRAGAVLRVASGLLSLAFGIFMIYSVGFVDGLFGAHPTWTPS